VRFLLLSDTHGAHSQVEYPPADVLIHAGDVTRSGTLAELAAFNDFLGSLPYSRKIVIAGNRDFCFQRQPAESRRILTHAVYLQDEEITVGGLRVYGTPWQPPFLDMAFNLPRGESLRVKWDLIPTGIDILVTHTPPLGIGDLTRRGAHVGCEELLPAVKRLHPRIHLFGHIHEAYGDQTADGIRFINASVMGVTMDIEHQPLLVELY
jgi:Icc-related predicted phosphoesterase